MRIFFASEVAQGIQPTVDGAMVYGVENSLFFAEEKTSIFWGGWIGVKVCRSLVYYHFLAVD
jgi:hypothetical protein